MISLFLIILLPTGLYQMGNEDFKDKATCEAARTKIIAKAASQTNPWLISQCGARDVPVEFRMFFNDAAIEQGTDPKTGPLKPGGPTI
jgi:hypothetical protein